MCNKTSKRTPHPHADVIHAWADGAEIQWLGNDGVWRDTPDPGWYPKDRYRIKPEQSDLEKYGVEVGDVWEGVSSMWYFVAYTEGGVFRTPDRDPIFLGTNSVLQFRRGVVNKL